MSSPAEVQPVESWVGPDSGRVLEGRYELREVCGAGGFARVYRAYDRKLRAYVAVKLLDAAATEMVRGRFDREVEISAVLVHPNLIRATDRGALDGRLWAVMPLLHGRTLWQRRGADWRQVCRWMRQFLEGVRALHEARAFAPTAARTRVLHRDIKPANCFVSDDGHLTILDFGLAKPIDQAARLTDTGVVIGTVAYLAPECLLGVAASERSDVYALGVTFFEALTGELPYVGDFVALRAGHLARRVARSVREVRREIPAELAALVQKAMAPLPAERPATVAVMLRQLDAMLRRLGDPVPPPTPAPRVVSRAAAVPAAAPGGRANGWRVAALAAIAAVLVGVAIFGGGSETPPARPAPTAAREARPPSAARVEAEPAPPVRAVVAAPVSAPPPAPVRAKRSGPPRALTAARAELEACRREHGAGAAISVATLLGVDAAGRVEHASVVGRPLTPETLCMEEALRRLEFPRGARREVRHTFHLDGSNQ